MSVDAAWAVLVTAAAALDEPVFVESVGSVGAARVVCGEIVCTGVTLEIALTLAARQVTEEAGREAGAPPLPPRASTGRTAADPGT